jgi:hypothetical protein
VPKLIELNAPQAISLPRETAETQGGVQAAAIGTLGKQVSSLGRSVMSYQKATANAAAAEYRMELRSLTKTIERSTDPAGRLEAFENQTPSIRARVLKKYRFASAPTFDESASLYEGDYRYSIDENAHTEMLQRTDAMQDGIATSISVHAASASDIEAVEETLSEGFATWDAMASDGDLTPIRLRALKRDTVFGTITNLSDENPELAQQVLKNHSSSLTPAQFAQFDNFLDDAVGINRQVDIADDLFTLYPDATVPALAALVKKIYNDGDITVRERDGINTRISAMVSDRETAANRTQQKADTAIIDLVYAADYDNMTPQNKAALRGSIERKPGLSPGGRSTALSVFDAQGVVKTDPATFGFLWSNPHLLGTPAEYDDAGNQTKPDYTLNGLATRLEPEHLMALQKEQTKRAGSSAANLEKSVGAFGTHSSLVTSIVNANFESRGIVNEKKRGVILLQMIEALSGKVPTQTNVQDAFDAILAGSQKPGRWYGYSTDYDYFPAATIRLASEEQPELLAVVAGSIVARTGRTPNDNELAEKVSRTLEDLESLRANPEAFAKKWQKIQSLAPRSLDSLSGVVDEGVLGEMVLAHQEKQEKEARTAEQERARAEAEAQRKAQEAERAEEDRTQSGTIRRLKGRPNSDLNPLPMNSGSFDADPISGGFMRADDAE